MTTTEIERLDARLDKMESNVDARFDKLEAKIDALATDVTNLKINLNKLTIWESIGKLSLGALLSGGFVEVIHFVGTGLHP